MISPTGGTVLINGKNITKDLDSIMNDLGLCPQDDILFPDLSVFEQLLFFGLVIHFINHIEHKIEMKKFNK